MLNQNAPDGDIDRVMDKLKQDIVDLTASDASSADDEVAPTEETEETPAGQAAARADAVAEAGRRVEGVSVPSIATRTPACMRRGFSGRYKNLGDSERASDLPGFFGPIVTGEWRSFWPLLNSRSGS